MFSAFFTGFFLGLSLIVAIGAQNAFVLRHGILRQHVFYIALFCAVSDALLNILGSYWNIIFFNNFMINIQIYFLVFHQFGFQVMALFD